MARRRMIDPNIWASEDVAKLNILERLLLIGMFSNADDYGKGRAHPAYLRSTVFPYDDIPVEEIENALNNIQEHINIVLYEVDGNQYYKFTNWERWQTVQKPQPSKIPDPVENNSGMSTEQVENCSGLKEKKINKKESSSSCNSSNQPVDTVDNVDKSEQDIQKVANEFTNCGYGTINHTTSEILEQLTHEYSAEWVCTALRVGLEQGKRTLSYVRGILENWRKEGGIRLEKPKKKPDTRGQPQKKRYHNFNQPALKYTNEQLKAIWKNEGG